MKRKDSYMKAANKMAMIGKRSQGRQEFRWGDCLKKDLKERKLKEEDAMDRDRQRNTIKSSWAIFMSMESKISCS